MLHENIAAQNTQGKSSGHPGEMPKGHPGNIPKDHPGAMQKNHMEGMIKGHPAEMPKGHPPMGGHPGHISKEMR